MPALAMALARGKVDAVGWFSGKACRVIHADGSCGWFQWMVHVDGARTPTQRGLISMGKATHAHGRKPIPHTVDGCETQCARLKPGLGVYREEHHF